MTAWHVLVLLGAGLAAGVVNAVAGGGTLITFPALLAVGLHPVAANVTNTAAVWPGYVGGWLSLRDQADRQLLTRLTAPTAAGAATGTAVLLLTPAGAFRALVPFLVLAATALIVVQPLLSRLRREPSPVGSALPWLPVAVFLAAGYGAYFGGGLGIILLAVLGLAVPAELLALNAVKTWLSLISNTVALVGFAVFGPVHWGAALLLAPATFAGGLLGARLARRLDPRWLLAAIAAFGVTVSALLFLR